MDQRTMHTNERGNDIKDSPDKITIYLQENKSGIQVEAHHDILWWFLLNLIDQFWDVVDKCDFDRDEKLGLLKAWVDGLSDLRDRRFPDIPHSEDKD